MTLHEAFGIPSWIPCIWLLVTNAVPQLLIFCIGRQAMHLEIQMTCCRLWEVWSTSQSPQSWGLPFLEHNSSPLFASCLADDIHSPAQLDHRLPSAPLCFREFSCRSIPVQDQVSNWVIPICKTEKELSCKTYVSYNLFRKGGTCRFNIWRLWFMAPFFSPSLCHCFSEGRIFTWFSRLAKHLAFV